MPRIVTTNQQREMALRMTTAVAEFGPEAVIYLDRGGRIPGTAIAAELGLPVFSVDVKYPLTRLTRKIPMGLRPLTWPLKEVLYRLTRPALGEQAVLPPAGTRLVLVDDSASSGRTLAAALHHLEMAGFPRDSIFVFVLRCGHGAQPLVDLFATRERVVFSP